MSNTVLLVLVASNAATFAQCLDEQQHLIGAEKWKNDSNDSFIQISVQIVFIYNIRLMERANANRVKAPNEAFGTRAQTGRRKKKWSHQLKLYNPYFVTIAIYPFLSC